MGVEDVHGNLPGAAEVGAVIQEKVQAGFQGLNVRLIDGGYFGDVVCLDGEQDCGSEEKDRVVNRRLRAVGDGWRGR